MLNYIAGWPLSVGETLALIAFASGVVAASAKAYGLVMRELRALRTDVQAVATSGKERGDEAKQQIEALVNRVSALERSAAVAAHAESSVTSQLSALQNSVGTLTGRIDNMMSVLAQRGRPD